MRQNQNKQAQLMGLKSTVLKPVNGHITLLHFLLETLAVSVVYSNVNTTR